ncbi:MAG TPA: hypothetical protein VHN80_13485, partial [Kineosporiaceae bacterium]|nr:hypothetical protein [Kineosporiaceae bacterium]
MSGSLIGPRRGAVVEAVAAQPLIDHHCHGVSTGDLDRSGFEALISEGGAPAAGTTNFDTPVGSAIRRHCAPLLDLPPHAPADTYLERRAVLGTREITRRMLAGLGTDRFCVDTGFRPDGLTTPAELAELAGLAAGSAREVVRLESVAESVAARGVDAAGFEPAFASALQMAVGASRAVAVKSIAAYRVGFDLDPARPATAEVTAAASRWLAAGPDPAGPDPAGPDPAGRWRLADPVLTRAVL